MKYLKDSCKNAYSVRAHNPFASLREMPAAVKRDRTLEWDGQLSHARESVSRMSLARQKISALR